MLDRTRLNVLKSLKIKKLRLDSDAVLRPAAASFRHVPASEVKL